MAKAKPSPSKSSHPAPAPEPPAIQLIAAKLIDESPTNPRRTFLDLDELAEDMKLRGMLQPVLVRPRPRGRYELVFGARRFRAAKLAAFDRVPAMVRDMSDKEVLETQIVENAKRADIHPLEEAIGYEALHRQHGYSVDDLAAKLGKSKAYVYARLKLCELCEPARGAFLEGTLTPSTALLVARIPSAKLQQQAVKDIGPGGRYRSEEAMSYRQAADHIQREFMLRLEAAPFATDDAGLVWSVGPCTTCPKRTGNQAELFADVGSADVCTDPHCYKLKVDACWKARQQQAKAAGQRVLTAEETKKVFPSEWTTNPGDGYVAMSASCYTDPKRRTYKQIAGKSLDKSQVVLARTPKGDIVELLPSSVAKKLERALPKPKPTKQEQEWKEQRKEREAAAKVRAQAEHELVEQLVAKAEATPEDVAWWRWLATHVGGATEKVAERRGLQFNRKKFGAAGEAIAAAAAGFSVAQLRSLIVERVCAGYHPEARVAACELYGLAKLPDDVEDVEYSDGADDDDDDDEDDGDGADDDGNLEDERSCRVCSCTERDPCEGGCQWVPDPEMKGDLCSSCLPLLGAIEAQAAAKKPVNRAQGG